MREERKFRSDFSLLNPSELKHLHTVFFGATLLKEKEDLISSLWLNVMEGKYRCIKNYQCDIRVMLAKLSESTLTLIVDSIKGNGKGSGGKMNKEQILIYLYNRF
jgi:hypothetical protein